METEVEKGGMLTRAICPECKLHRGHRANCAKNRTEETKDLSIEAYRKFLRDKIVMADDFGFTVEPGSINSWVKPHARTAVQWAVRGGRRALFESFGLAKTSQQIAIIDCILKQLAFMLVEAPLRGLIVAPLGVRQEFQRDATAMGLSIQFVRSIEEAQEPGIYITNYETVRDGKLNPAHFKVASLDEAAILSSFGGTKTFREFMRLFEAVPYRFVATATPDPNEYIELLSYAAFLGIMEVSQAKTRWFKRDSTKADKLTLHPHKEREFWMWVSSWALFLNRPSDLGPEYSDEGYALPELEIVYHEVPVDHTDAPPDRDGQSRMFRNASTGVSEAAREKRDSLGARVRRMQDILDSEPEEHYLLWHDLEAERHAIKSAVPKAVDVYGLQRATQEGEQQLEAAVMDFADGRIQYLAAKPSMFGAGANWQRHCARAIFCGIGYSFRSFVQALHRVYRFLQKRKVVIHIIYAESEKLILENLLEKWDRHKEQLKKMAAIIAEYGLSVAAMNQSLERSLGISRAEVKGDKFLMVNNDCVEELETMEPDSVGLIVTSPPFSTMYEYSPSYNDFGHTDGNQHFFEQMDFLTPRLLKVLKPGRIAAVHVKDRIVPGGVSGLGFQTLYPFHADCIYHFQKHGFALLGIKTIVTDVVRENNQTYRLGWTEQCKDGSKMGVGTPEYLLLFRKPPTESINAYADEPVVKVKPECVTEDGEIVAFDRDLPILPNSGYSRGRWQIDAHGFTRSSGDRLLRPEDFDGLTHEEIFRTFRKYSQENVYDFEQHVRLTEELEKRGILPVTFMLLQPQSWHPDVWTDITRMRTLNSSQYAKGKQMHLCAMQLDLVDRVIQQMSMPEEVVLDPFSGIGTVPQCAVKLGRKAIGTELSVDYFADAVGYCREAEDKVMTPTLFDLIAEPVEA